MASDPHRFMPEFDEELDEELDRWTSWSVPREAVPTIPRVRVLCVGATGQSGSTLLSRMLGRLPGFVAVGEVGRIWDKGLLANVACGCGEPFRSCHFWSRVGQEAFGGWDEIDPAEAVRLRDAVTLKERRAPHAAALPFLLHPELWPGLRADLDGYAALLGRVYRALDRVTEGRIIVDSMKLPGHVYLASTMQAIDARVVHLTRDPRGYAYSNTKWVEHQGGPAGSFRARRTPRKSAIKWSWCNLAFEGLARHGTRMRRVRYEDLVRSPRTTLLHAAHVMDVALPDDALWFVGDGEVQLVAQHLVAGSRGRLRHGPTPLRSDDAWRAGLARSDRRTVEALTWPMRRRYDYRV